MKVVTAGIIQNADREILIVRRAPGEKLNGFWEFPGGKVEPGESERECLKRELAEELAIEVRVGRFVAENLFRYDHGEFLLRAYSVDLIVGELTLQVHDDFSWVPPDDLLSYRLAPADVPIAESLIQSAKTS